MPIIVPRPADDAVLEALREAQSRGALPTTLSTAEMREVAAELRARAIFTARGANVHFVTELKAVVEEVSAGRMDAAEARVTLLQMLRGLGYTPEGGFPDTPEGAVPDAVQGTIEDLSSARRLDLIVQTQTELMAGAGQQARGHEAERLQAAPAWELVRVVPVETPRNWGGPYIGTPPRSGGVTDPRSRWEIAGGIYYGARSDRMVALKGDPVWGELGSSGNFDDALDVDHPPFAFNSGMWLQEVTLAEARRLGVTGPAGETIEEWISGVRRPRTLRGEMPPAPRLSMRGADREAMESFLEETKALPAEEGGEGYDFNAVLARSVARAQEAYDRQEGGAR